MPPDYPYSIHLIHPDSTYNFDSYEAACYFLDTTHLMSAAAKAGTLRDIEAIRHSIVPADEPPNEVVTSFMIFFFAVAVLFFSWFLFYRNDKDEVTESLPPGTDAEPGKHRHFVYRGCDLDLDSVKLEIICLKYISFFRLLDNAGQKVFLLRLQGFMQRKHFYMYGEDCYREMPVLLSATAVQLCFGLPNFNLDNYTIISIRPQAYLGYEPLRILTGNVQGNTITISWEHFLKDHLDADDGNNVGLHEMAHAFAMQLLYAPGRYKRTSGLLQAFYQLLETFIGNQKNGASPLFDAYSLQNTDECWAKCIEIFFERGDEMQHYYPQLYNGVKEILNQ